MGGSQAGRSPAQRAVSPIMAGTAIPICPTDTAAARIIIIMVTTATHNVATPLEIRAELLTGLAPLDGKAGARKRFKSRRERRVAHKVVHPDEPPT
jgi:hypothetical protein